MSCVRYPLHCGVSDKCVKWPSWCIHEFFSFIHVYYDLNMKYLCYIRVACVLGLLCSPFVYFFRILFLSPISLMLVRVTWQVRVLVISSSLSFHLSPSPSFIATSSSSAIYWYLHPNSMCLFSPFLLPLFLFSSSLILVPFIGFMLCIN